MQRRVAQMGVTLDTARNNISGAYDRQSSKDRFEAEGGNSNVGGLGNVMKHNTSKGVHYKSHETGSESSDHLKHQAVDDEEITGAEKGNYQLQNSMQRQNESLIGKEKVEEEEFRQVVGQPAESTSSGILTKSFLQLLQAGDSPQNQRRQVMGVFQSNPKLLKDYLKSREPRYHLGPVQHQGFQGHSGFKGLPLPWKGEGLHMPYDFNLQQQMRGHQPAWSQQQQMVGGHLQLLPASLVKQQPSFQQLQLQPATLQQQHQMVGGVQFEEGQPVKQKSRNLQHNASTPSFGKDF